MEEDVLVERRHTFFLIHKTKLSFLVRKEPTAASLDSPLTQELFLVSVQLLSLPLVLVSFIRSYPW